MADTSIHNALDSHVNLAILRKGQAIRSTNYWDSEQARNGYCFLSWNAGAARLLLPDTLKPTLREMRSAAHVIVSRDPWHGQGWSDGLELLFEDDSDNPFCLLLATEQTDRSLTKHEAGRSFLFTVWTRGGEKLRRRGAIQNRQRAYVFEALGQQEQPRLGDSRSRSPQGARYARSEVITCRQVTDCPVQS